MSDATWEQFRRTCVRVEVPGGFLDVEPAACEAQESFPSDAVGLMHILTAWNPQGSAASEADNRAANRRLAAELSEQPGLAIRSVTGYGGGPLDDVDTWREEGFGIEGMSRGEAMRLAIAHDQRAIFEWRNEPGGFRLIACDGSADEARGWASALVHG